MQKRKVIRLKKAAHSGKGQKHGKKRTKEQILEHLNKKLEEFRLLSTEEQNLINQERFVPVEETMELLNHWLENDQRMRDESPSGRYIGPEQYSIRKYYLPD